MNGLESLFQQSLTQHSAMVVGLAFLGGVVSSVLPCTIAMLPIVVSYIGGYNSGRSQRETLFQVGLFILGVALVMTVLGVLASLLGLTFGFWLGSGWYYAIGLLAILMGLQLLEVIHLPLPQFVTQFPSSENGKFWTPFFLGVTFGAASSPCGTPFLAGILGLISQEKNVLLGGTSLFFYALGQGLLLLVVGLFTGFLKHLAVLRRVGSAMNKVSAGAFILLGLAMIAEGANVLTDVLAFFHLQ